MASRGFRRLVKTQKPAFPFSGKWEKYLQGLRTLSPASLLLSDRWPVLEWPVELPLRRDRVAFPGGICVGGASRSCKGADVPSGSLTPGLHGYKLLGLVCDVFSYFDWILGEICPN